MKIYANSSDLTHQQDRLHQLYELANDMVDLLDENHISEVELWDYKFYGPIPRIGIINIKVCGDWKHDLLRAQYLIKENFSVIRVDTASLEDTGEDWGPELQTYYVYTDIPE